MMMLTPGELRGLSSHYTGNCMGCQRCDLYERITRGEPGAVEAYVAHMKEQHGKKVKTTGQPG